MQSFVQPFMLSYNRAFIHVSVKLRGYVKLFVLDQLMTLKGCDIDDVTFIIREREREFNFVCEMH